MELWQDLTYSISHLCYVIKPRTRASEVIIADATSSQNYESSATCEGILGGCCRFHQGKRNNAK